MWTASIDHDALGSPQFGVWCDWCYRCQVTGLGRSFFETTVAPRKKTMTMDTKQQTDTASYLCLLLCCAVALSFVCLPDFTRGGVSQVHVQSSDNSIVLARTAKTRELAHCKPSMFCRLDCSPQFKGPVSGQAAYFVKRFRFWPQRIER